MKKNILPALLAMAFVSNAGAQELLSPDGNVKLNFELDKEGRPTYRLNYHGKDVIKPSHLGFQLRDNVEAQFFAEVPQQSASSAKTDLQTGFVVAETKTSSFNETWSPVWCE